MSKKCLLNGLNLDGIKLPHIFLYLIVAKTRTGSSVVVGQMLSADQKASTIGFWLDWWLNRFKPPEEAIMDESAALMKACILRFALCTVKEYVRRCFAVLNGSKAMLPSCYIRNDISHFLKNLHSLGVFRSIDKRVKFFYLDCFGLLILAESFDTLKKLLKNILILANSQWEGTNSNNEPLPADMSRKTLSKVIRTHDLKFVTKIDEKSEEAQEIVVEDGDIEDKCEEIDCSSEEDEMAWFNNMLTDIPIDDEVSCDANASNVKGNMFYLPELTNVLKKLCFRLPFWSAVMKKEFGSTDFVATSSDVESKFNLLKNNIFRGEQLPMRLDSFLDKYIKSVVGSVKLSSANYNEYMVKHGHLKNCSSYKHKAH